MPGAGKSTCIDYLTAQGYPNVYFGGVVVEETKRRYGKVSEELEKLVREDLRATEGKDVIVNRILAKIDDLIAKGERRIVADGLYSWTEYKIFKEHFGDNAIIVAITAPRHARHERLATRPIRPLTSEKASRRDYAEIENIEKGGPIANADYTIVNDSTAEAMLEKLKAVLKTTRFNEADGYLTSAL